MIEPGTNGRRSRGVAREATRQVTSRKTGIRLTWILPSTAKERRSASALRWLWHNRNEASNLGHRQRVPPEHGLSHNNPDV